MTLTARHGEGDRVSGGRGACNDIADIMIRGGDEVFGFVQQPPVQFYYMLSAAENMIVRGIERPNVVEPPRPIQ